eukprot:sb/3474832/
MEIMRLDYAGTSEEMNVEPQLQKLIKNQEEQLNSVKTSVQKVKAYSTILAQNCATVSPVVRKSSQDPAPTPLSERDKNLVIFGIIPETTDRLTKTSVDGLFTELKEKPKVNSMKRIGEKNEKGPRPLLVSLVR